MAWEIIMLPGQTSLCKHYNVESSESDCFFSSTFSVNKETISTELKMLNHRFIWRSLHILHVYTQGDNHRLMT